MLQLLPWHLFVGNPTKTTEAAAYCLQGCVARGQLGSTTCHRMLMATLLPLPASLLALAKVKRAMKHWCNHTSSINNSSNSRSNGMVEGDSIFVK
jgi:hypothetical protein